MEETFPFFELAPEVQVQVFEYLGARDASRRRVSKGMDRRLKALARAQPQLVATAGSPEDAIEKAFAGLGCAPPNFAVAFTDNAPDSDGTEVEEDSWLSKLSLSLPKGACLIGAEGPSQANIGGKLSCSGQYDARGMLSLMLGAFPSAAIETFAVTDERGYDEDTPNDQQLQRVMDRLRSSGVEYQLFIVLVAGNGGYEIVDDAISMLNSAFPGRAVVGGVARRVFATIEGAAGAASAGEAAQALATEAAAFDVESASVKELKTHITRFGLSHADCVEKSELRVRAAEATAAAAEAAEAAMSDNGPTLVCMNNGLAIAALGGDCPLHALVSRGVAPLSPAFKVEQLSEIEMANGQSIHCCESVTPLVYDGDEAGNTPAPLTASAALGALNRGGQTFLGVKNPDSRGFELLSQGSMRLMEGRGLLLPKGVIHTGTEGTETAHLRVYALTAEACAADVDAQLKALASELAEDKRELMGALMFSCNGRGPSSMGAGLGKMLDARVCERNFPKLPLVGLWAGGEIGPEAIADLEGGVLRSGDTAMKTALQGFTAVFGVFVVPDRAAARRALLEEAETFA